MQTWKSTGPNKGPMAARLESGQQTQKSMGSGELQLQWTTAVNLLNMGHEDQPGCLGDGLYQLIAATTMVEFCNGQYVPIFKPQSQKVSYFIKNLNIYLNEDNFNFQNHE